MASLPPQQSSQPRRSSPETASNAPSQPQSSQSPVRTRSEDSQTLYLNKAEEDTNDTEPQTEDKQQDPAPPAQGGQDEAEEKKCWICFSDSSEDSAETSRWRSPCPCALVAHEECLLDWIADMEAPGSRRRNQTITGPKIECPQCKTEIKLARPRNLVVDAVRAVESASSQLVTPGALTIVSATLYQSSMLFGVHSIYSVFGSEDGIRILRPLLQNYVRPPVELHTNRALLSQVLALSLDHLKRWRLYAGIPLIMPILVLARTSLADSVLPVLPILFFATQNYGSHEKLDFVTWPPSASMAFAVLPYIRSAYNAYYKRVWAPKEKQWLKEIQPRVTQDAAQAENGAQAENDIFGQLRPRQDDENIFEIRVDGWDEWEDAADQVNDDQAPPHEALREAVNQIEREQQEQGQDDGGVPAPVPQEELLGQVRRHAEQLQEEQQAQQGVPPQQPNPQPQQPAAAAGGERNLAFSVTAIAETVMGALLFPTIAGISGELLKWWLPRSWTTPPPRSWARVFPVFPVEGFLQAKWGRSLVGGCLFVVLKDAVMLYARWKMAQMHRRRSIVEWKDRKESRTKTKT